MADSKLFRVSRARFACAVAVALALHASPAAAYIGPGAGFAVVGATLVLLRRARDDERLVLLVSLLLF